MTSTDRNTHRIQAITAIRSARYWIERGADRLALRSLLDALEHRAYARGEAVAQ